METEPKRQTDKQIEKLRMEEAVYKDYCLYVDRPYQSRTELIKWIMKRHDLKRGTAYAILRRMRERTSGAKNS